MSVLLTAVGQKPKGSKVRFKTSNASTITPPVQKVSKQATVDESSSDDTWSASSSAASSNATRQQSRGSRSKHKLSVSNSSAGNEAMRRKATSVSDDVKRFVTFEERPRGWKLVQANLVRIIEYGRQEGILPPLAAQDGEGKEGFAGLIQAAEEGQAKKPLSSDKVNLPTNDISLMHEAIPFLPLPIALLCMAANILLPGSGTLLSGIFGLCMGQPRINVKEGRSIVALIVNACVGVAQFMTITFFLVGWFWSIAWGGLLIIHSMQYREALRQRRKEAVATAAIEALTKDSILHRRDVKTLVKAHGKETLKKAA